MEQVNSYVKIQKARIIGSFFLLAFLLYGIGRNIFESEILAEKYTGALLIIANSIIVLLIGIFLRKTIQKHNVLIGNIYLFSRVFEAIALASIVLNIIPSVNVALDYGYFLGMIVLGIGSIPMCFLLLKYKPLSILISKLSQLNFQPSSSNSISIDLLSCVFITFEFGAR